MRPEFVQTSMGIIGSLGFALLFGIRGTKPLGCIALGSGIGWIVYLVSVAGGHGKAFGMLASSLVIAACSEILARVIKTPVILLLVPMLIPEIPGGDLYYTMYSLVEGDTDKFASLLQLVLAEAGAIALGIILASYAAGLINNIYRHVRPCALFPNKSPTDSWQDRKPK